MKSTIKGIVLAAIAVYFGCASLATPVMIVPLQNGSGTYEINYTHKNLFDCNYYYIDTILTSSRFFLDFKDVTLYKQMYEREMLFPGAKDKIQNVYSLAFHHNQAYTVAPEFFMVVDGRQFKPVFRSGRTKTMTSINQGSTSTSAYSTITYNVSSDLLNAMKTMKTMTLKIGDVSKDLDEKSVSQARSFVVDSMGFDYQSFHAKVTSLKK